MFFVSMRLSSLQVFLLVGAGTFFYQSFLLGSQLEISFLTHMLFGGKAQTQSFKHNFLQNY